MNEKFFLFFSDIRLQRENSPSLEWKDWSDKSAVCEIAPVKQHLYVWKKNAVPIQEECKNACEGIEKHESYFYLLQKGNKFAHKVAKDPSGKRIEGGSEGDAAHQEDDVGGGQICCKERKQVVWPTALHNVHLAVTEKWFTIGHVNAVKILPSLETVILAALSEFLLIKLGSVLSFDVVLKK